MEANKATIKRETTNVSLVLQVNGRELQITLTDDNPNGIKAAFNSLLQELKKGLLLFEPEDDGQDLFTHVCKEYITQLNIELAAVYKEIEFYSLLDLPNDETSASCEGEASPSTVS